MGKVQIAIVAAIAWVAWLAWHKHLDRVEAASLAAITDERGFLELAPPTGFSTNQVLIVAAQNCPREGAVRADKLAREMAEQGIPYVRSSSIAFTPPDPADIDRFVERHNKVMNSEVPIVFVNGKVKSNPSLDEVIAEYQSVAR